MQSVQNVVKALLVLVRPFVEGNSKGMGRSSGTHQRSKELTIACVAFHNVAEFTKVCIPLEADMFLMETIRHVTLYAALYS